MTELEVFPVAIGEYLHHDRLDVDTEVAEVVTLFTEFGGREVPWTVDMPDRGGDAVDERLLAWSGAPAGDTVLYWVGHGWSDNRTASLAHAKSPKAVKTIGVTPAALADHIARREGDAADTAWAIVIIDACRSARFVELLSAAVDDHRGPRRLMLVGVSGEGSTALGQFTSTLRTVLCWTFRADPEIELGRLWLELKRNLPEKAQVIPKNIEWAALRRPVPPLAAPAPLDVEAEVKAVMAGLTEDERRHFVPKAQGAELGELSWYFEGRRAEHARIASWLRNPTRGLLVVTGDAGSGKSALLGHLVVQSHPQLRRVLARHNLTAEVPADVRPPDDAFDAVLHLTGLGSAEVIGRLVTDLAVGEPPAKANLQEQVGWLCAAVGGKPHTILVDALDEAVAPLAVARAVLRPLAAVPSMRVIVGTRRSTQEGADWPRVDGRDLLDALGAVDDATIVVERDVLAIARYVHRRLDVAVDRGLLRAEDIDITTAAAVISNTGQQFLFARLAVHEILARPELLSDLGLSDLITGDHRQLLTNAVLRLKADRAVNGPLLQALAYSRGRGVPMRDGVWSAMASALVDGPEVTDADAGSLLEAAAPYVMLDREHGQTVYRLAHRTFAEHFTMEADASGEVLPDDRRRHHVIALRLIADAVADPAAELNPYLAHYLSAHVGAAGEQAWRHLADNPGLLDRLDPDAVGADAMRTAFGRFPLPPAIAGVVGSRHLLGRATPSDRPGLRQLAMTRHAGVVHHGEGGADGATWTVLWASAVRQPTHMTLTGHTGSVNAVAAVPGRDGRAVLATGSSDCTVRLWDPVTGMPIGEPLTGHTGSVNAVTAVSGPDGRAVLATGSSDCTVRLWDPATGMPIGEPLTGHTERILAVAAVPGPYGHTLLATGSSDCTVRLWDPATGTPIGDPLTGHTDLVLAVATVRGSDGRALLATGSYDDTVRLWDPVNRTPIGDPLTGHTRQVLAVAEVPGPEGRTFLATGSEDGTVRLWDLATGTPVGDSLLGHTGAVNAVATVPDSHGRVLLATGSEDGTVRLWDPATGTPVGDPLTGHTDGIRAVAAIPGPRGRTLLVTGSHDDTVRLWDPANSAPADDFVAGHTGPVRAMAVFPGPRERMLLATGSEDETVRLWDASTGTPIGDPLHTRMGPVRALASVRGPDKRMLLATGSSAGVVGLWDPATGTIVCTLLTGRVFTMVAVPGPGGQMLMATGSEDGTVRLWDPATGTPVGESLSGHTSAVWAVATVPGPCGQILLAIGSHDGMVRLWNPVTGTPVGDPLTGHTNSVTAAAAVPCSHENTLLATVSDDGMVCLWDPATGDLVCHLLSGHTGPVWALAAVPDPHGRILLATGSYDGTVRLWNPATGIPISTLHLEVGIRTLCPLPAGRLAVGTTEGVAVLVVKALISG